MGYLLQENGEKLSNLNLVCFDGSQVVNQMVKENEAISMVLQNPYEMGCQAVETLQNYFSGDEEDIEDQYIQVEIVDREHPADREYSRREDILWHMY